MRLTLDARNYRADVQPQSADELWRLAGVLEAGDIVTGKTERKVKVGEDAVTRKTLTLTLIVTKAELQGDVLRVSGVTREGTDDIPKGSHHTITVHSGDTLVIEKDWPSWQLEKLREEEAHPILVLLMDREEAVFAELRREPTVLSTIKGAVQKKGIDGGSPYWEELARELTAYDARIRPRHLIVASPAFFKEYVIKILPLELQKKTVAATISATGTAALSELVRRPEVKQVLAAERYTQESLLVDQLMEAIHKDKAAWGTADVAEQASLGALSMVLVATSHVRDARENATYETLAATLKSVEKAKGSVHILETSAASQIEKLGGIAGVKRW